MLRRTESGSISFYVPKKDLEAEVKTLEFSTPEKWGGEIELTDGSRFYVEPLNYEPKLPVTLRASRVGGMDDD